MKLPRRVAVLGAPFDEIYNVHYSELSWYTHPGVGIIAIFETNMYPIICGNTYGIAIRSYVETLKFMIGELRLRDLDPLIDKRLEFAQMRAFAANPVVESLLRHECSAIRNPGSDRRR
ncbi:MAG: hypothetical protein QOF63_1597 [Thermoanaerobaculia bacterium]|jgi:hypothetical protein|nr:hypothetical protein [Thermoanaerobaculia bacterium]